LISIIYLHFKKKTAREIDVKKIGKTGKFLVGLNKGMKYNWWLRFTSAGFIKIATFSFL